MCVHVVHNGNVLSKKNPDCYFESALFICCQVFVFYKLLIVGAVAQYL